MGGGSSVPRVEDKVVITACVNSDSAALARLLSNSSVAANRERVKRFRDDAGNNVVAVAAIHDRRDCLSMLLSKKCIDVDSVNRDGDSALIVVSRMNVFNSLTVLIKPGNANIEAVDVSANTPLLVAASFGSLACVEHLLLCRANIAHRNKHQRTVLHNAAFHGHVETLSALLRFNKNDIDSCDSRGFAPIALAALKGNIDCVTVLLSHGAKVDTPDELGNTPLINLAIANEPMDIHSSIINELIANKANIEAKNTAGDSALLATIASNVSLEKTTMVDLLISKQANIESTNNAKQSALTVAVSLDRLHLIEFLICHKCNIEGNNNAMTPLTVAVLSGFGNGVGLLLANGANHRLVNPITKQTLLMVACQYGHVDVAKQLLEVCSNDNNNDNANSNSNSSYESNYDSNNYNASNANELEELLAVDCDGNTSLLLSVKHNQPACVKLLLDRSSALKNTSAGNIGEDRMMAIANAAGETALSVALSNDFQECLVWLNERKEALERIVIAARTKQENEDAFEKDSEAAFRRRTILAKGNNNHSTGGFGIGANGSGKRAPGGWGKGSGKVESVRLAAVTDMNEET